MRIKTFAGYLEHLFTLGIIVLNCNETRKLILLDTVGLFIGADEHLKYINKIISVSLC